MLLVIAAAAALSCQPDLARRELPEFGRDADDFTPKGWVRESVHHPDLDSDTKPDLVVVARRPDGERRKLVAAVYTPRSLRNVGEAPLPGFPLGEAEIAFRRGVLVVTDLTGGTTADSTTLRYRYEGGAADGAMRFIGVDVTRYSRTNRHDAVSVSRNWLTGEEVRRRDRLTRSGYAPQRPQRRRGAPRCYFMEDTAEPEAYLSPQQP